MAPVPIEVDLDRLFAPPTVAERQIIESEWAALRRSTAYTPGNVQIAFEETRPDGSRIAILSHTTGLTAATHYGAVRIPPGVVPADGWPVVAYTHGGAQGFDLVETLERFVTGTLVDVGSESVLVVPTFRSETMVNTPIGDLLSNGEISIWDKDVDDALALVTATFRAYPELTDDRSFGTIGGSRGGTVALLMGLRDPRVQAAATYYGPMDFFAPSVRSIAEAYLAGTSSEELGSELSLPKMVPYMLNTFLQPLADGIISYETARLELLKRSPAHFTYLLPNTIAHHHGCDGLVPFEHFEALQANEADIPEDAELYAYDPECAGGNSNRGFHSMSEKIMPGNGNRTAAFLERHLK